MSNSILGQLPIIPLHLQGGKKSIKMLYNIHFKITHE